MIEYSILCSEFIAEKNIGLFWKFVDTLGAIDATTDEKAYTFFRSKAAALLSEQEVALLDFSLGNLLDNVLFVLSIVVFWSYGSDFFFGFVSCFCSFVLVTTRLII